VSARQRESKKLLLMVANGSGACAKDKRNLRLFLKNLLKAVSLHKITFFLFARAQRVRECNFINVVYL
jgi:hypothetical protein